MIKQKVKSVCGSWDYKFGSKRDALRQDEINEEIENLFKRENATKIINIIMLSENFAFILYEYEDKEGDN